jgi:hypothetical protein
MKIKDILITKIWIIVIIKALIVTIVATTVMYKFKTWYEPRRTVDI